MTRVLVIGATGYLGSAVAQALLLTGQHTVYAICRNAAKAKGLAVLELIPVVCPDPAGQPEPLLKAIRENNINAVIDCTAAYGDSSKFVDAVKSVGKERLDTFKAEGISRGPKIGYIYTSGAWVHGNNPNALVSDLDPVGVKSALAPPEDIVGWRPQLERQILAASDVLDVMIIRPAMLYGRGSGSWGAIFGPIMAAIKEGKTDIPVDAPATSQSPMIHVDDIADAIARGVAKLPLFSGTAVYPVFDIFSTSENIRDILTAFADVVSTEIGSGKKIKLDLTGGDENVLTKAIGSTIKGTSARAKQLLDWEPRRIGLTLGMDVYARSFLASQ